MAAALNALFAIVILSLVGRGFCQCELANLKISQTNTGETIEGKPEYEVTINNDCACNQLNVRINCAGFDTVEQVDPTIFKKDSGDLCVLKNDEPVGPQESIKFKYAWDAQAALTPASSRVACS